MGMVVEDWSPLRFQPLFKTALWGGTRLESLLHAPVEALPTGEAWLLSDVGKNQSVVATGPLAGTTLRTLMADHGRALLGRDVPPDTRFPLLLKFIDAALPLSIQVHPTDALARTLEGADARGKTEAWVVLEAQPDATIYAGLQPGTTKAMLEQTDAWEDFVTAYTPEVDDCFFIPAGTIHAIGAGVLLFEVQQTSDITYRLSDWGRVDPLTKQPRELHREKGLQCLDDTLGPCAPVRATHEEHAGLGFEAIVQCDYFTLDRWHATRPFRVGEPGRCRVLVGVGGRGVVRHAGTDHDIGYGDVLLLPAALDECECIPTGPLTLLECGLPEEQP